MLFAGDDVIGEVIEIHRGSGIDGKLMQGRCENPGVGLKRFGQVREDAALESPENRKIEISRSWRSFWENFFRDLKVSPRNCTTFLHLPFFPTGPPRAGNCEKLVFGAVSGHMRVKTAQTSLKTG